MSNQKWRVFYAICELLEERHLVIEVRAGVTVLDLVSQVMEAIL